LSHHSLILGATESPDSCGFSVRGSAATVLAVHLKGHPKYVQCLGEEIWLTRPHSLCQLYQSRRGSFCLSAPPGIKLGIELRHQRIVLPDGIENA
jgi:hypothetical protein